MTTKDESLAIETTNLTYKFGTSEKIGLEKINLQIPWGTTNLLVGPNGAGKSTLLKILAGKTLIKEGSLKIGGFDPFKFSINRNEQHNSDINNQITYLGTEWAANPVVKRDIPVKLLVSSIGGETYPERRDELISIMDLDPDWSMAYISDGERRRVQLVMGLLKPWRLLLLDEVTVDLDVIVRSKLLNFLKSECQTRNCCVIYATHIFDGLGKNWCDRIIHLNSGRKTDDVDVGNISFVHNENGKDVEISEEEKRYQIKLAESLHPLALHWLRADLEERGSREEEKEMMARRHNDWNNERDGKYFDGDASTLMNYFKATRSYETRE
ncbi:hypothetical protein CAAN1_01S12860 [[Candida] anglica]|uniref:ABC transporter domain-containing protein n=1 Tax=[Candida] anglica TaxID=148631 RepID=A0ABP0EPJ2_9ASCO